MTIIHCLYLSRYTLIILLLYIIYLSPTPPPPPPSSSSSSPTPRAAFDALSIGGERGGADFFAPRESVSHRIAAATARNNFHFSQPCVGPCHVSPIPDFVVVVVSTVVFCKYIVRGLHAHSSGVIQNSRSTTSVLEKHFRFPAHSAPKIF